MIKDPISYIRSIVSHTPLGEIRNAAKIEYQDFGEPFGRELRVERLRVE